MEAHYGVTAPAAVYEVDGRRYEATSPGFADAIVEAHASHYRPRCLCVADGVEMYVARLIGPEAGYIVKRMPDTGHRHATSCPSWAPSAEESGLAPLLGTAITEDPQTGLTTLKLDFPLVKLPARSLLPPMGNTKDTVRSDGPRLSLRGLLHYLWDQAELTRWHPGFAGKRHWAVVRRHLLQAAAGMRVGGSELLSRLYVPEPFSVEAREAIGARRLAQWQPAMAVLGQPQPLMLLVGEVKEIVPARFGYKVVVRHMPDQAFGIDVMLYRRIARRFESELALWAAADDLRMVMIGTFGVAASGLASVGELSTMTVTKEWLPVDNPFEQQLVERLVAESRAFLKAFTSSAYPDGAGASATLTDCDGQPRLMFIDAVDRTIVTPRSSPRESGTAWQWRPSAEPMPAFPAPLTMRRVIHQPHPNRQIVNP